MAFVGSITMGGAILGAGAIGGASALGSAFIGAGAAKDAAGVQANAAANSLALQREMFNKSQQNYEGAKANFDPYLNLGKGATYTLGDMYGIGRDGSTGGQQDFSKFTNSPDFQFASQQGNLALDRANNAKGLNLSGGALKDSMQFNQGLASQQFGNYFNRLMSLSNIGSTAAQGVGNLTSGQANNSAAMSGQMSNSIQGQGQATASGIVGQANALSGGLSGVSNSANGMVNNSLLMNAINRSSYAAPGATPNAAYNPGPAYGPGY